MASSQAADQAGRRKFSESYKTLLYLDGHFVLLVAIHQVQGLALVHHAKRALPQLLQQLDLVTGDLPLVRDVHWTDRQDIHYSNLILSWGVLPLIPGVHWAENKMNTGLRTIYPLQQFDRHGEFSHSSKMYTGLRTRYPLQQYDLVMVFSHSSQMYTGLRTRYLFQQFDLVMGISPTHPRCTPGQEQNIHYSNLISSRGDLPLIRDVHWKNENLLTTCPSSLMPKQPGPKLEQSNLLQGTSNLPQGSKQYKSNT